MPIPLSSSRAPVWPHGCVGSISHADGLCVAHVARHRDLAGIGVDVEQVNAVTFDLAGHVCAPDEWNRIARDSTWDIDAATLCFSAKEAVFKAYFPATLAFLEFTDVELDVDWTRGVFAASLMSGDKPAAAGHRRFQGRFARVGNYVATAVWISRSPGP